MIHALNSGNLSRVEFNERLEEVMGPIDLKIGIDTGRLLCQAASRLSGRFFVGVEWKEEQSQVAVSRVNRLGLDNVLVVNMEAHDFVKDFVADASFQTIHIYFPTPHPGAIRLDRRLINRSFAIELGRVLKQGGELRIVTDHQQYFDEICGQFDADSWWAVDWQQLDLGQADGCIVGSPCEIEYRFMGREVLALQLLRGCG